MYCIENLVWLDTFLDKNRKLICRRITNFERHDASNFRGIYMITTTLNFKITQQIGKQRNMHLKVVKSKVNDS